MILDMPYTVDDQPTEDWTVDQVLHWWLLHAKSETDASRDEWIAKIQTQLDEGKHRLWQDHEQVVLQTMTEQPQKQGRGGEEGDDGSSDANNLMSMENIDPQQPSVAIPTRSEGGSVKDTMKEPSRHNLTTAPTTTTTGNKSSGIRLMVEIVRGDYVGKIFELDQLVQEPAVVGRSRGKKVLKHGISLPKDPEVSTTHGKFVAKANGRSVCYIDDGSTNGSMINGQLIQSHVEIPLESGMEIQVGGTIMLVTF